MIIVVLSLKDVNDYINDNNFLTSLGHLLNLVIVNNIGSNPVPSICSLTMLYLGVNWLGLYTKVGNQVALALRNASAWVLGIQLHVPGPQSPDPPGIIMPTPSPSLSAPREKPSWRLEGEIGI